MLIAMKDANALGGKVYIHGQIVFEGTPDSLREAPDIRCNWLEVD